MHAVLVEVDLGDVDRDVALKNLRGDIVPRVSAAPGFQSGSWMAPNQEGKGLALLIFDTEENAGRAAEMVKVGSNPQPGATVERCEVREVAATA
jgi:hypothetical protein